MVSELQIDRKIPPLQRALKLGIVGGLGARAGADILNQIVRLTPVNSEGDHREISFEQKPMSEPIGMLEDDYMPTHRKFYVFDTLLHMEKNGCDAALLPCFITHTFIEELKAELNLKLITLTDAIKNYLSKHYAPEVRIGVLTTPYVQSKNLFEKIVGDHKRVLYPDLDQQQQMLEAVYGPGGFKAGNLDEAIANAVGVAADNLIKKGADVIVPGMTEIPLMLPMLVQQNTKNILNTNKIYAQFALDQTSRTTSRPFKVGVVGGVGPAATVDFLSKIIAYTGAKKDQEHIKLLVEHNPQIPDRTSNLVGKGPDPTIALYATCKKLERGGADIIAIPCNTAHAFTSRIQKHLNVPIISITDETAKHIKSEHPEIMKVGIVATTGTVSSNLYQQALEEYGLMSICPRPASQNQVMDAIYGDKGVKAGFTEGLCKEQIQSVIFDLCDAGAQGIILGCTELPLIISCDKVEDLPAIFDPTMILAKKCVKTTFAFHSQNADD